MFLIKKMKTVPSPFFNFFLFRLIVKNLPCGKKTRWDEAKVREHFGKFGTLTDIRLKLSERTGAAKFAFVGFSDAESCQTAIKKMDGTFVKGSKLLVSEKVYKPQKFLIFYKNKIPLLFYPSILKK